MLRTVKLIKMTKKIPDWSDIASEPDVFFSLFLDSKRIKFSQMLCNEKNKQKYDLIKLQVFFFEKKDCK